MLGRSPVPARHRLAVIPAVLGMAIAGVQLQGTTAHAADVAQCFRGPNPNVYYKLTNLATGKALDVSGRSTANGAAVIQYPYNGGANQQWRIQCADGGAYKITARHSGLVLDVRGGSTAEGARVQQWGYASGTNQQWYFGQVGADDSGLITYQIQSRRSSKVLDLTSDQLNVQQSTPDLDDRSQQWTFEQVGTV